MDSHVTSVGILGCRATTNQPTTNKDENDKDDDKSAIVVCVHVGLVLVDLLASITRIETHTHTGPPSVSRSIVVHRIGLTPTMMVKALLSIQFNNDSFQHGRFQINTQRSLRCRP